MSADLFAAVDAAAVAIEDARANLAKLKASAEAYAERLDELHQRVDDESEALRKASLADALNGTTLADPRALTDARAAYAAACTARDDLDAMIEAAEAELDESTDGRGVPLGPLHRAHFEALRAVAHKLEPACRARVIAAAETLASAQREWLDVATRAGVPCSVGHSDPGIAAALRRHGVWTEGEYGRAGTTLWGDAVSIAATEAQLRALAKTT